MRALAVFGAVLVLSACGREAPRGRMELTARTTRDTIPFSAPAEGYWCAADSSVEIVAVRKDSGMALALFPVDSLRPGTYPVGSLTDSVYARPRARVAARWFGKALVEGYYSTTGVVNLLSGPELTGDFTATMQGMMYEAREELQGTFRGVRVRPAAEPCGLQRDTTGRDSAGRGGPE